MMNRILLTMAVGVAAIGAIANGTAADTTAAATQQQRRWSGTASASCECTGGRCKNISCSVTGALSYDDARGRLKAQLEAQARNEGGRIVGSITFSIRASFFDAADADNDNSSATANANTCFDLAQQAKGWSYTCTLVAYNGATVVATMPYTTFARDESDWLLYQGNKVNVWGQQLDRAKVKWNSISARNVVKTPVP